MLSSKVPDIDSDNRQCVIVDKYANIISIVMYKKKKEIVYKIKMKYLAKCFSLKRCFVNKPQMTLDSFNSRSLTDSRWTVDCE